MKQDPLQLLLAKRAFKIPDPNDCINWAVSALENGSDTPSLRILAGLDHADSQEIELYFKRSLGELGLSEQVANAEQIVVQDILNQYKQGTVSPDQLTSQLARWSWTHSKTLWALGFWDGLADARGSGPSEAHYYYPDYSHERFETIVREEADYLQEHLQSPPLPDWPEIGHCTACDSFAKPSFVEVRPAWWHGIFSKKKLGRPYQIAVCGKCGSRTVRGLFAITLRRRYEWECLSVAKPPTP